MSLLKPFTQEIAWIENFEFKVGLTPLSDWYIPVSAVIGYLLSIFLCKQLVNFRRKPFDLHKVSLAYNMIMCVVATIMFTLLAGEIVDKLQNHGFWSFFCDVEMIHTKGRIWLLYYTHILSKLFELTDTLILALRGRPTTFLHVYHHAVVVMFGWHQVSTQPCVQWVGHILNLGVHVILYTYFSLHGLGYDVWWKKYLTACQVWQFVILGTAGLVAMGYRTMFAINPEWGAACHGTWSGAIFGMVIVFSYLYLFGDFYFKRYRPRKNPEAKKL